MKEENKAHIIDMIPNVKPLKKYLSGIRVARVRQHYISKTEVIQGEHNVLKKKEIVNNYLTKSMWGGVLGPNSFCR